MSEEIKVERRKASTLSGIIGVLFAIILGGLSWWMTKINEKADRVPVLEERLSGLQKSVDEIKTGITALLARK